MLYCCGGVPEDHTALQARTAVLDGQHCVWHMHACLAGFCAPPTLTLTLQKTGGRLANSRGTGAARRAAGSKQSYNANATLHVMLTAAYWLDNRSGVNLVLSDLDRRWLRGLPGPGLKSESHTGL
jgi:hypothetical protein